MKNTFVALLILLYAYAVTSKLADVAAFRGQLYNQAFPHAVADVLLLALPALEVAAIALLLWPRTVRYGLWLSLALLGAFTGYIGLVRLHVWARVPCSCGGILSHMGWNAHLLFNLFFILINVLAIDRQTGEAENPEQSRPHYT